MQQLQHLGEDVLVRAPQQRQRGVGGEDAELGQRHLLALQAGALIDVGLLQGSSGVGVNTGGSRDCPVHKPVKLANIDSRVCHQEGNVLFNDALNTFYFYGYMVKDHSDSERERKPAAATWATLSD